MSKIVFQIDYEVSDEVVARVQQLLDDTLLHDVDFAGAEFEIVRGDYTEISDDGGHADAYDLLRLYYAVTGTIAGTIDCPDGYRSISSGTHFHE